MQNSNGAYNSNSTIPLGNSNINASNIGLLTTTNSSHLMVQSNGAMTSDNNNGSMVRKCLGKNKQADCLQGQEHANTRWECNFCTDSKDDFTKHCKNIYKRVKWRDFVDNIKPDSSGYYRCVYYSTDKHHVESHYSKASSEQHSPSGSRKKQFQNSYPTGLIYSPGPYGVKRKSTSGNGSDFEEYESQDPKKQLLLYDNVNGTDGLEIAKDTWVLSESTKTQDLILDFHKKLEIPSDQATRAIEELHKQGYFIISGLRSLKPDQWQRLGLPMAIEEELRKQITSLKHYHSQLGPSTPSSSGPNNGNPLRSNDGHGTRIVSVSSGNNGESESSPHSPPSSSSHQGNGSVNGPSNNSNNGNSGQSSHPGQPVYLYPGNPWGVSSTSGTPTGSFPYTPIHVAHSHPLYITPSYVVPDENPTILGHPEQVEHHHLSHHHHHNSGNPHSDYGEEKDSKAIDDNEVTPLEVPQMENNSLRKQDHS